MVEAFFAVSQNNKVADRENSSKIFGMNTTENLNAFRESKRNCADGILVGANTIIINNPTLLNTNRTNIRIIIDKYNNIPFKSKIFQICPEKTYILTLGKDNDYFNKLLQLGVHIIKVQKDNILQTINSLSINRLLIEGGVKTLEFFTECNFIDKYTIIKFPFVLSNDSIAFNFDIIKNLKNESYIFDNIYEIYNYER